MVKICLKSFHVSYWRIHKGRIQGLEEEASNSASRWVGTMQDWIITASIYWRCSYRACYCKICLKGFQSSDQLSHETAFLWNSVSLVPKYTFKWENKRQRKKTDSKNKINALNEALTRTFEYTFWTSGVQPPQPD